MAQTVQHDPTNAPDKSKPYCLMNSDGSVADWFATHADAIKAMGQTSNASRRMYSEEMMFSLTPVGVSFAEGDDGVWIEALQAKDYHTDGYGKVPVDTGKLTRLAESVKKRIRGIDLATDYEHGLDRAKGSKASGTIKDAKVDGDKLLLNVAFTDTAKAEIKAGEWKYFSSDWLDTYKHDDGTVHTDVLLGGGLTNRPVAKGLNPLPINFSELYEEVGYDEEEAMLESIAMSEGYQFATLSYAQKKALPASKFLYIEPDGTKHLPVPDVAHIRAAITRLSQKATGTVKGESWLTDSLRSSLLAKARAMLSRSNKTMSEESMNELLKKLATQLGIQFSENIDEDELGEKIFAETKKLGEEVEPLRKLKETAENQKQFHELFPEQHRQMEEDRQFRIQAISTQFSEGIGRKRFTEHVGKKDSEGNDVVVTTTKGLSAKALDKVKETHLKFSEGTATVADFSETIDTIMDGGIVDYGEVGTTQSGGTKERGVDEVPVGAGVQEARQAFAEKVLETMEEHNKENPEQRITFAEALVPTAQKFPKMYDAYMGFGSRSEA